MTENEGGRARGLAVIGVCSLVLVVVHSVLWDVVRYEDGELIARMSDLVAAGSDKAGLFRVSLVADMGGSYLLLAPIALHLWRVLRDRDPWLVDLATVAAVVYVTVGALTAAALAIGGESLIRDYAVAPLGDRAAVAASFTGLMDAALGAWQLLGLGAGGFWWASVGTLLRERHRWLGRFSIAFGVMGMAVALGRAAGLDYEVAGPATLAFTPIGVWAAWVCLATADDAPDPRRQPA